MVPVIWAFFSADVNAGTASAARIAIIAITTSNSINVKALTRSRCLGRLNNEEGLFSFIFIWVFFSFYWVPPSHQATADKGSEGFLRRVLFCSGVGGLYCSGVGGVVLFWGWGGCIVL